MNTDSRSFLIDVEPVRRQWDAWRQSRKRGERIPESLWQGAAELARAFGAGRVCRALGVGYHALKERALGPGESGRSDAKPTAFIELPAPAPMVRSECLIELEDGRGAKMTLRLAPGNGNEVLALAQAFWRRQS